MSEEEPLVDRVVASTSLEKGLRPRATTRDSIGTGGDRDTQRSSIGGVAGGSSLRCGGGGHPAQGSGGQATERNPVALGSIRLSHVQVDRSRAACTWVRENALLIAWLQVDRSRRACASLKLPNTWLSHVQVGRSLHSKDEEPFVDRGAASTLR